MWGGRDWFGGEAAVGGKWGVGRAGWRVGEGGVRRCGCKCNAGCGGGDVGRGWGGVWWSGEAGGRECMVCGGDGSRLGWVWDGRWVCGSSYKPKGISI